jgi:hypothetical protein
MGMFAGIKESKTQEGGVYFLPGLYVVRIDKVKVGETRKEEQFFVVETTILESDNPERRPGSSCSWMTLDRFDGFLGSVKSFVAVATDSDPDEVDEAGVEMLVSNANPLMGTILRVEALNIKTRSQRDFTKVTFKPATPEQLKKYEKVTA